MPSSNAQTPGAPCVRAVAAASRGAAGLPVRWPTAAVSELRRRRRRRRSLRRAAAGSRQEPRYPQRAHPQPGAYPAHGGISTGPHRAGPFTLVPLPATRASLSRHRAGGRAASAVLTSARSATSASGARIRSRQTAVEPGRAVFPLGTRDTKRIRARSIALVGEAAHVIPDRRQGSTSASDARPRRSRGGSAPRRRDVGSAEVNASYALAPARCAPGRPPRPLDLSRTTGLSPVQARAARALSA